MTSFQEKLVDAVHFDKNSPSFKDKNKKEPSME